MSLQLVAKKLNDLEQTRIYTLEHMEQMSFEGDSVVSKCEFDHFETNTTNVFC